MKIDLIEAAGNSIALVTADRIILNNLDDALHILGNCGYQGATAIIINVENISLDFFNLKTRLAGDILQKFSNYNMRLAIVGNFAKYTSESLRDFIYESNKAGRINFVGSIEDAKMILTR